VYCYNNNIVLLLLLLISYYDFIIKVVMAKDDCDAIMFDTFLEPMYQGKIIYILF